MSEVYSSVSASSTALTHRAADASFGCANLLPILVLLSQAYEAVRAMSVTTLKLGLPYLRLLT